MQQEFLDIFTFNTWEILAIISLVALLAIQLYFYLAYYRKPYKIAKAEKDEANPKPGKWKVSVIISSENEMMRLSKNLPIILEQDYPDFEVIVINNGSTDETDDLIESLKLKYNNLYCTYVPYSSDKEFGRRKLAFTLGAKAAKGDILIFTEPHSRPLTKDWITLMTRDIDDNKEVILGASFFTQEDAFYNRVARFDNHLFNMQFLSKALQDQPFTGIYRNVAFKKDLFFRNKGFASHLALENGEDVFINQIVNSENTGICLDPNSFVKASVDNYSLWKRIKKNYSVAKTSFKGNSIRFFGLETASRVLFYLGFIGLSVYSIMHENWGLLILAILVFIIRLVTQLIVINKSTKYFGAGNFYLSLIVVDILQPIYNINFRTRHKKVRGRG